MDKYDNFATLQRNEKEGEDYTILVRQRDSPIAIVAPHGGGIEPGTLDIADALAGSEYMFYAFKGIKKRGNAVLHLSSNRFDEPTGVRISTNAAIVITVHGTRDKEQMVLIGGNNQDLKAAILHGLRAAGFSAEISEIPGLRGVNPENICNRCRSGKGVQLEISRGLRESLFENIGRRPLREKTARFYHFVETIKSVISDHRPALLTG